MAERSGPDAPVRAVFVAQLPPPVHGQAVADLELSRLVDVDLAVVPLRFARSVDDIGRLRPGKVLAVVTLVVRIVVTRLRTGATVLTYSLGARSRLPVLRDALVLLATRPWFRRTVLHLHTGDYGHRVSEERGLVGRLVRRAFGSADLILLDPALDVAGARLPDPASVSYLNYGVTDLAVEGGRTTSEVPAVEGERPTGEVPSVEGERTTGEVPTVLFLGNLYESKGTHVLLRAGAELARRDVACRLVFAGSSPGDDDLAAFDRRVDELGLRDVVERIGPVSGETKTATFAGADVFCFPTEYEAEGMPLVVMEAMGAGLPVVSTRWRAIPSTVVEGETGFLVDPGDVAALADRLEALLGDPALAASMGRAGRSRFEERFTLDRFRAEFARIVRQAAGQDGAPAVLP